MKNCPCWPLKIGFVCIGLLHRALIGSVSWQSMASRQSWRQDAASKPERVSFSCFHQHHGHRTRRSTCRALIAERCLLSKSFLLPKVSFYHFTEFTQLLLCTTLVYPRLQPRRAKLGSLNEKVGMSQHSCSLKFRNGDVFYSLKFSCILARHCNSSLVVGLPAHCK